MNLLTYWTILAVFKIVEEITDPLVSSWFPLYCECKILLLFCVQSLNLHIKEEDVDDLMTQESEKNDHIKSRKVYHEIFHQIYLFTQGRKYGI